MFGTIEEEMARVDALVQQMAIGRYVKILPKPLPRRLGLKRLWRQRFDREEYQNVSRDVLEQRFGSEQGEILKHATDSRWGDSRCDFYTTRPPFLSEVIELGNHCSCCRVPFEFRMGTKESRNWKGFTIDRIDTGLGPNGCGKLVLLDEPDSRGFRYHWENVPGYEANMQALCMACNVIKSKCEDKANVISALLSKYPMDLTNYYSEREFESSSTVSNEYRTGIARYIYGCPVTDCTLEGPGPCYKCGVGSSNRVYLLHEQTWVRSCSQHEYPQWKALNDFERTFFGYVKYGRQVDESVLQSLLFTQPGEGQRDILMSMRTTAKMFWESLEEAEEVMSEDDEPSD